MLDTFLLYKNNPKYKNIDLHTDIKNRQKHIQIVMICRVTICVYMCVSRVAYACGWVRLSVVGVGGDEHTQK